MDHLRHHACFYACICIQPGGDSVSAAGATWLPEGDDLSSVCSDDTLSISPPAAQVQALISVSVDALLPSFVGYMQSRTRESSGSAVPLPQGQPGEN